MLSFDVKSEDINNNANDLFLLSHGEDFDSTYLSPLRLETRCSLSTLINFRMNLKVITDDIKHLVFSCYWFACCGSNL